ncbi:hypothetical protein E6R18_18120 [Streptomyces sp. A1277]|nr:hypothetical protein E6R18_18120 [Streptomyces sp. A1277]
MFESRQGHGCSPQIRLLFSLHSLGIQKLSILLPQARPPTGHQASSGAWGFVVNHDPQPVDKFFVHRLCGSLSTAYPQDSDCFPQPEGASPHRCPLFGNTTPAVTGPSERRHTKRDGWPVGNAGKAGDRPGEKLPCPVYGLCTTLGCPQKAQVVHRATHRAGG